MKNSQKRKFLIHIGFPKTATTMLQRQVFPYCHSYRYLGKYDGINDLNLFPVPNFIGRLAYGSELDLEFAFQKFDAFIKNEEMRRYSTIDENIPILMSFETFTFVVFKPFNFTMGVWGADPSRIFERLHRFGEKFGYDLRILLMERDEKEIIHKFLCAIILSYSTYRKVEYSGKILAG
jgi:hypothetical protein